MTSPSERTSLVIRELLSTDDLRGFSSGSEVLDSWLRSRAIDNRNKGFGTTHVAVVSDVVLGFVTTSACEIERARVKRGQGPERWAALLIGRMAVRRENAKQGLGKRLLAHAFAIADAQFRLSGCAVVLVDAKPEAVGYYQQFGFKKLLARVGDAAPTATSAVRLYIAIQTVQAAIVGAALPAGTTS